MAFISLKDSVCILAVKVPAVSILAGIEKVYLSYMAFISCSIHRIGCLMKESLANVLRLRSATEFGNVA